MSGPSTDATVLRMLLTFLTLALLSAAGVAVGKSRGSGDVRSADTALVESTTSVVATTAVTTTVVRTIVAATSVASTSVARSTTVSPTTTLPPPPVFELYESEGVNFRFNPCQNPITILFNPVGYLDDGQVARIEAVLIEQAAEVSVLTGMNIVYGGLTDEVSQDKYKSGETILIHVGMPGEGLLKAGDDYPSTMTYSWDRSSGGFREVDVAQAQINANNSSYFDAHNFDTIGTQLLMVILGQALGLALLDDYDMVAGGSTDAAHWGDEIMNWSSTPLVPTWGPGDREGLSLVGAVNGCF